MANEASLEARNVAGAMTSMHIDELISNLAIVSLKKGRREDALGFFRTVLEIDPGDAIAARYLEDLNRG